MSDLKDTFDSEKAEDLAAEAVEQATDAAEDAAAEAERAAEEAAEVGAEDVADTATAVVAATDAGDEKPTAQQTVKLPVFIGVAVAALVIGLVVGAFAFGAKSVSLGGKTVLTSDQIDTVVATYSYNGKSYQITARDVLTQSGTLESVANDDGTYDVPAATDIVTYARTAAVVTAAENMGITASDDEVSSYAEEKFGSSDFSTIASTYSVDEDVAKEMIMDSCVMSKLRDEKVDVDLPDQPVAPTEPAEDATDTPTAEYASYIIGLAGDEWDSANNTWARTDGDYYAALSTYEITNDSATYAAAQAAYYVAYSDYSTAYSESTTAWSEYCNSILSNVSLSLGGLNV